MPANWMEVTSLSFNSLLLLERVQLSWLPGWLPEAELGLALRANPAVAWFMGHKCEEIAGWVERVTAAAPAQLPAPAEVRAAELSVMRSMVDLLVYAVDPSIYDAQPFLAWNTTELTGMADFRGQTVIDVGSGTGRLALPVAALAKTVFAVEPVGTLRAYLKARARRIDLTNIYPVDGLITDLPFPDGFADITMGGHVFGETPGTELAELERVTRLGGMILLCPGNNDADNETHRFLATHGFEYGRFEEPRDGWKRKYWRQR